MSKPQTALEVVPTLTGCPVQSLTALTYGETGGKSVKFFGRFWHENRVGSCLAIFCIHVSCSFPLDALQLSSASAFSYNSKTNRDINAIVTRS